MKLNINDEIKIRILKQLSDRKVYSFYSLAKTGLSKKRELALNPP
ncbi:MAG: hypothetical protein U9N38_06845 [Thermodesulfobacteriota bacterium]|nr:hypothetical protein [Thermodesulfobacteriota bacterium]